MAWDSASGESSSRGAKLAAEEEAGNEESDEKELATEEVELELMLELDEDITGEDDAGAEVGVGDPPPSPPPPPPPQADIINTNVHAPRWRNIYFVERSGIGVCICNLFRIITRTIDGAMAQLSTSLERYDFAGIYKIRYGFHCLQRN